MNKNTSVTMAAAVAVAGVLTLAVMGVAIPHNAFAGNYNQCCEKQQPQPCCEKQTVSSQNAVGGNGGSGGAGGAGGEGGHGGTNVANSTSTSTSASCCAKGYENTAYVSSNSTSSSGNVTQKANGGDANGGHGGNANGGDARI